MSIWKKTALAAGLAATALAITSPAMARDYHRGNDNTAAVAIGAGILGLAVGAIAASSSRDDRYDNGRYYDGYNGYGPAYTSGWSYRDGYYWDRDNRRHSRDEYRHYQRSHDDRRGGWNQRGDNDRRGPAGDRWDHDGDRGDRRRGY